MHTDPILAIDETTGIQTTHDDFTVNDVSTTTLPTRFTNLLPGGVIGAARSSNQVATFSGTVTDVGFTNADKTPLVGVASSLYTLDGTQIFLYTSTTDNNVVFGRKGTSSGADPNGQLIFALFLDTGVATGPGDAGATGAFLWMAQFQPMQHPDGTDPNDVIWLENVLHVTTSTSVTFPALGAPSGQNLFLMISDGTPAAGEAAIVVTGKNPANQSTGASITTGDTVNTGQGGGKTTLGTNNQMIDPGEGLFFTFVTMNAASLPYAIPDLDQNEADVEANILFQSYLGATGASFSVVQLQPPKQTMMQLTAINNSDHTEIGETFIDGLHPYATETVNITSVTVVRTAKNGSTSTVFSFNAIDTTGAVTQNGVTVDFTGNTAVITGIVQGDRITYVTDGNHNRLLIDHVGSGPTRASFDIGDFSLNGTAASATLLGPVAIVDDGLAASTATATGTVDEDGLTGGNTDPTQPGDVTDAALTATGSVTTLFTAGVDVPLSYSLSMDTSGLPALSSGGEPLHYVVTSGLVGSELVYTLTATATNAVGPTVFTFTLNSVSGAYTFTLERRLDHPSLDGETDDNTENDITIDLSSILRASDKDTDSVGAAEGALQIIVDDDMPLATNVQLTGTVDEDGLAGGNTDPTQVGDVADEALTASGNVATLFSPGADGLASYSLSTTTSGLPALSSGGSALLYAVTSALVGAELVYTLTAKADELGEPTVFTFALNSVTGAYTFTLARRVDHLSLDGLTGDDTENDITIDLSSILRLTDNDGDTVSAAANGLRIIVDDDMPIDFTPDSITLQNTGTASGTEDLNSGNKVGADGFGSLVFVDTVPGDDLLRDTDGNILQSGEQNIVLSGYGTGTLTGTIGSGPTLQTVFTVTLDTTNHEYTVTFFQPIDDGGSIDFLGAAPVRSGNPRYNILDNVAGTSIDLLFSGGDTGGGLPTAHTVNVSTQGAGTDNQSMNPGETLRIDFGQGVTLSGSPNGSDFSVATPTPPDTNWHETVNGFFFLLTQNTASGTTGTVHLRAIDADDDTILVGDTAPGNDVTDTITKVTVNGIVVFENGVGSTTTINGQTVTAFFKDNGVVITGLSEGQTGDGVGGDDPIIQVFTADGYSRIEISNYSGVAHNGSTLGGGSFDIAPAGLEVATAGDPFSFELPVQMTDFDGDSGEVAFIGIDINPVPV